MRFAISSGTFGPHSTLKMTDQATGAAVEFALLGGTTLKYLCPLGGGLFDILAGHTTPEELAQHKGSRSRMMAPWSNRIQHSRYEFGGVEHAIPNDNPAKPHIAHGLVNTVVFDVAGQRASDDYAQVKLSTSALRPGAFEGYPFAVDVTIEYILTPSRMLVEIAGKNAGKEPAPFASGWHPYFHFTGEGIDHLRLAVPSRRKVVTDAELIPLEGKAGWQATKDAGELDFRPGRKFEGKPVGATFIDAAYGDLAADADGYSRTWAQDPHTGMRITVLQRGGLVHVFSADRKSLAMEPVQQMTNAYNRPECRKAITLAPGKESRFAFGVQMDVVPGR